MLENVFNKKLKKSFSPLCVSWGLFYFEWSWETVPNKKDKKKY